jgi:uncharacterized protein (TIGR02646 family)
VIPVLLKPEPPDFNLRVRQRGQDWIAKHRLDPNLALPDHLEYPKPAYWAKQPDGYSCLEQLYALYNEICAYTGLHISGGAKSVDHFVPKSRLVGLAFEWSNYRLACRNINTLKQDFEDVLDPFFLEPEVFFLELNTGTIYVNPSLENTELGLRADQTITRLKLWRLNKIRAEYFACYQNHDLSRNLLQKRAPFVYLEAERQNLL